MMVLILMISCIAVVACDGGDDDDGDEATSEATAAATSDETADATAEATSEETSKPTSKPTGDDDIFGDFGNLDDLKSYRMHMESTAEMPSMTGGGMETITVIMDMAVVNDPSPKATHMIMPDPSGMGMGDVEVITIGNTQWMKLGDSWMESTVEDVSSQEPTDITDYLDMDSDMDYQGKEKVNGVNCKHYKVDADINVNVADAPGGVGELAAHYKGEVWIADEGGLPEVMIRSKGTTEMETMGEKMVSDDQIDITDINESITISPPPADQISDMPDFGDMMGDMEGMEDFDLEDMEGMFEGLEGMEGMDLESMMPPQ